MILLANNTVQSGNQIVNTTAETLLNDSLRMAATVFNATDQGHLFAVEAEGVLSTKASSSGTLILKLKIGAIILVTLPTITLPAGLTNAGWSFRGRALRCLTGTAGKYSASADFILDNAGSPLTALGRNPGLGIAGQVTVNTQSAGLFGLSGQFSVADPGNSLTALLVSIKEER